MKKQILSIDGGGLKGIFATQVLTEIEDTVDGRLYEYFDLISGTSTGGIIAASIALGIPAKEIRNLYVENAEQIFPRNKKAERSFKRMFSTKYSNAALKDALINTFGNATIGDCKTRLLIPAYNLTTGKVQIFKTPHAEDLQVDYKRKVVDVLLSTTAAPTYLPPHRWFSGTYIDGGIGANNPSLLAVIEGISYRCGWNKEDIFLLSLGCMESVLNATTGKEKMGFADARKIISIFMNAESQYSDNIVRILLGTDHYLRINAFDFSGRAALDQSEAQTLDYLQVMGRNIAQNYISDCQKLFLDCKADKYTPCY